MKCLVCHATWDAAKGSLCPHCGYNQAAPGNNEIEKIETAREGFKNKVSSVENRTEVTLWNKMGPWIGVALAFVIFIFWLRACSSFGWRLF